MLCRLKGIVWIAEAASLTVHSAEDQRPDGVEFYIRRHVEVLSGILVNLRIGKKKKKSFSLVYQMLTGKYTSTSKEGK